MLDDSTQTKARMWREKARNFQSRGYVTSEMAKKKRDNMRQRYVLLLHLSSEAICRLKKKTKQNKNKTTYLLRRKE
jgi:hypothetical protein